MLIIAMHVQAIHYNDKHKIRMRFSFFFEAETRERNIGNVFIILKNWPSKKIAHNIIVHVHSSSVNHKVRK